MRREPFAVAIHKAAFYRAATNQDNLDEPFFLLSLEQDHALLPNAALLKDLQICLTI